MTEKTINIYEKVMFQMIKISNTYKSITDLSLFRNSIINIVRPLFPMSNFEIIKLPEHIYIGQTKILHTCNKNTFRIPNGLGMLIKTNGSNAYRIGKWIDWDSLYGIVVTQFSNGTKYLGEYGINNTPDGNGKHIIPGKLVFDGQYRQGFKQGAGVTAHYLEGTSQIIKISIGYFDMNEPVGVHIESDLVTNTTYKLTYSDLDMTYTKQKCTLFITDINIRSLNLNTYNNIDICQILNTKSIDTTMRELQQQQRKQQQQQLAIDDALEDVEIINDDIEKCKICWDNDINCVILECGHIAMCMDCFNDPNFIKDKGCPICRADIVRVVQTYNS
jgi:hypothetical protein